MIRSLCNILLKVVLWLGSSWLLFNSVSISFSNEVAATEIFHICFFHGMVSNAILFFGILYCFPRQEGRLSRAFLGRMMWLFLGVTVLEFLIDDLVLAFMSIDLPLLLRLEFRLWAVVGNLVIMAAGLFSGLVFDWFHQHRVAREVREQQVLTELNLLKSRINPHFLFNVLNGIFFMAYKNGDEETAEAIARLSHMMRYMLQEVSAERVALKGELEYLENYVAMQRLRLAETIPVVFSIEGQAGEMSIPPILLLPFVENAFKHGVSNAQPTPITINIRIGQGTLDLMVENHIHPCSEQQGSGFGLENVRRRLQLLYPGKYRLEAGEQEGLFRVHLRLETDGAQSKLVGKQPPILEERSV